MLAAIDDEGQLEQLVTDHSNECRRIGLPSDNELHLPGARLPSASSRKVARNCSAVPIGQCEAGGT